MDFSFRRAFSSLNVAIKAEYEERPQVIKLTSSTDDTAQIEVKRDEGIPFDQAITAINVALKELKLDPLHRDLIFRLLRDNVGDSVPLDIPKDAMMKFFDDLNNNAVLKLSIGKFREDWKTEFDNEVLRIADRRPDHYDSSEEREQPRRNNRRWGRRDNQQAYDTYEGQTEVEEVEDDEKMYARNENRLGVKGSAFALILSVIAKFEEEGQNFSQKRAMSYLSKCAKSKKGWINRDEFCSAVEKCVVSLTKPSLSNFVRSRSMSRLSDRDR